MSRPVYKIDKNFSMPLALQRRIALDAEAIAGVNSGFFVSPHKAALELAIQYDPEKWQGLTEYQKDNYVKSLAKRYRRNLKK